MKKIRPPRNRYVPVLTSENYYYLGNSLEEAEKIAKAKGSYVSSGNLSGNNYTNEVKEATYRVVK